MTRTPSRTVPRAARAALALAVLAPSLAAWGCGGGGTPAEQRARQARKGEGDVVVAVAWPWEARKEVRFGEGVDLAVEEVNAAGGIGGRKLRIVREDDRESVNEGRLVAQRIAENPEVVAVIGHLQSYVTVPAAAIYDLSGLVLFSPASTDAELTAQGYARTFRGIFTDHDTGVQMADYAREHGYRRVGIYYVRNNYGRALANSFEERAAANGITVAARASYDGSQNVDPRSFEPTLQEWKQQRIDAVFLAAEVPLAGQLLRKIREAGIEVPVMGGDAMSSPALISVGGAAAEGTVVAASFHPGEPRPEVRSFVDAFRKRYNVDPDPGSALGYDAVRVLAEAMKKAPSTAPDDVAKAFAGLRHAGVTGTFQFDGKGDLAARRTVRLVVRNGRFEYLTDTPAVAVAAPAAQP